MLYSKDMNEYDVCILSKNFYDRYPEKEYPEILNKNNRPYLVLLVKINENYYGIPFRSNINHKYCFVIENNRGLKEGLDYTKSVVINSGDIAGEAYLRPHTLPQIEKFFHIIKRDFNAFLDKYSKISKKSVLTKREKMILNNSTLKYFKDQNTKFNIINCDIKIDFELSKEMCDLIENAEIADLYGNYTFYKNLVNAIDAQAKEDVTHHKLKESQRNKLAERYCL